MSTILEFSSVSGKSKRFSLHDVSFKLEEGYIYAITGENGCGKSTLLRYILSDKKLYTGVIRVGGEDIIGQYVRIMNDIGVISEDNCFLGLCDPVQNGKALGVFYDNFDMNRYTELLKQMGILNCYSYRTMSRGEKIKMQFAFGLSHSPKLFLMDEPTEGLDPIFKKEFYDTLRHLIAEIGITVLMVNHNIHEIKFNSDYMAIMRDGRLEEFHESMEG
ncbi:MAG TPA: hypothetical protein DEO82_04805 [Eubacterium sp.]|nr:hypothetical protein [Eubacterium sp.]